MSSVLRQPNVLATVRVLYCVKWSGHELEMIPNVTFLLTKIIYSNKTIAIFYLFYSVITVCVLSFIHTFVFLLFIYSVIIHV